MGAWHLEAFKMALYMVFPVSLFHYFNQPEYFESWVITYKKENYNVSKEDSEAINKTIKELKDKSDKEYIAKLEKNIT